MVMLDGIALHAVFLLEGEFDEAWKLVVSVVAVSVDICVCCPDHEHDYWAQ